MSEGRYPVGKLPAPALARLLAGVPDDDPRVLLGPGIGNDCAVIDTGETLLVCKSDPITFVTGELGHYLVQINANDVVTTGARPRWLLVTLLLPEASADWALVESIMGQVNAACAELGAQLVGGHTEITHGLDRPIAVGCLLGEVTRERLVTPAGATPGDRLLLTKGVPIEGTAIIAAELAERLRGRVAEDDLAAAGRFLREPGISVVRDAEVALAAGRVTAMHDPTEGGLRAALWELAQACGHTLRVDLAAVPVPEVSARLCEALGADPLATIASGALLLTVAADDSEAVVAALREAGIPCAEIGEVVAGEPRVEHRVGSTLEVLGEPARDEIARLACEGPD